MKAGEAKPYLDALQADLQQEADPQLRAWYETEVSLTPEHQEATAIQEKLEGFRDGLAQLLEKSRSTEGTSEESTTETVFEGVEEVIDEDEWLTPEERKEKSVLAWLKDVTDEYRTNIRTANSFANRSKKREKQMALADKRFCRHFEQYGPDKQHIVYDADALKYAIRGLAPEHTRLAALVTKSSVDYLHTNGVEFAEDRTAFAGIIRNSVGDSLTADAFDMMLTAVHDKKNFINNPELAVRLRIALAHTLFEITDDIRPEYFDKIVDTAYMRNGIIPNAENYVSAIEAFITLGETGYNKQLVADLLNAQLAIFQAKVAYIPHYDDYYDDYRTFRSDPLMLAAGKNLVTRYNIDQRKEYDNSEFHNFFRNTQHYEKVAVITIKDGQFFGNEVGMPKFDDDVPEPWRESFRGSDLYKKRVAQLAPKSLAHELITATVKSIGGSSAQHSHTLDFPISPGVAVSIAVDAEEVDRQRTMQEYDDVINKAFSRILNADRDILSSSYYQKSDEREFAIGRSVELLQMDDYKVAVFAVIRPTVPADVIMAGPHSALSVPFRHKAHEYADIDRARNAIEAKKERIWQNRHNYLGRRPIKFRLPDSYRENRLMSVEMRQHEDRSRIVVIAHHEEGDLRFLFSDTFDYVGRGLEAGQTAVSTSFEDLVVSLFGEWACRPVIETSEGTVSKEDTRSKVNLGFLRFLPEGFRFSDRQRLIFRREQHGNLAEESLRRKAQDPTGLGRNSTYVRENYDPTKPPLEVYYEPSVLGVRV